MVERGARAGEMEVEIENREQSTPVVSVTIAPRGRCYRLAVRVGEQLGRVQPREMVYRPHLTLQGVYGDVDVAVVDALVREVASTTRPFTVEICGIGVLASPVDPELLFLHLNVNKSEPLLALYGRIKGRLDAHGFRTYKYSPEEWVPHLTLTSGRWSRRELDTLLRELDPDTPGCLLPVAEIDVNCRDREGQWQLVNRHPFAAPE
jgi:2'-5' RNA ligase